MAKESKSSTEYLVLMRTNTGDFPAAIFRTQASAEEHADALTEDDHHALAALYAKEASGPATICIVTFENGRPNKPHQHRVVNWYQAREAVERPA